LNKTETYQIVEHNYTFFRKYEPVFYDATSPWGRAHFYAPTKKIASLTVSTLIFNIIAIWLMSAVLYIALLKDWMKKLLSYFERTLLRN